MPNFILIHEPDDWSEVFPRWLVEEVLSRQLSFGGTLSYLVDKSVKWEGRTTHHSFLRVIGDYMSRKPKSNGTASGHGSNGSGGKSSDAKWIWANCKLSDEDIANLEQSDATLEYLATSLIALADDGIGFTVKSVDEGKSKCVTIYRPNFPSSGVTLGVSSFGGSVRDAILAVLYKLDTYGGGDFTGFDVEVSDKSERPRFR